MKRLKLFPKTFFYTLGLMLFVVVIAHILIYLLAPHMQLELSSTQNSLDHIIVSVNESKIVMQSIQKALPISLLCCLFISIVCSLLFSKAIADPIKRISRSTERMMKLDRAANCSIHTSDEIGILAQNVDKLYSDLLTTIEHLEQEKETVRDMERSKADFLRAASHELKTPVTALNATLENMILKVGKYSDYDQYLPKCKEIVESLSRMIYEILETSKLNTSETPQAVNISEVLEEICEPYQMIAAAHQISFSVDLPDQITLNIPVDRFKKAVSNIIANAVQYTEAGKHVSIYAEDHNIIIENECEVVSREEITRLFEPFYRPEYSRDNESGGNGLGLYIVETTFKSMNISYSFEPMPDNSGMIFTIYL